VENIWWPSVENSTSIETARGYKTAWERNIEPEFGTKLLKEITALMLQEFVYKLEKQYPNAHTVKNKYGVFQSILAEAFRLDLIEKSFKDKIRVPKVSRKTVRQELDFDLATRIIQILEGTVYEAPAWAMLMFGLRHGEVLGLRPSDIERRKDRYVITLSQSRQRKETRNRLKNKDEGEVRAFGIPIEWGEKLLSSKSPMASEDAPLFRNANDKPILSNTFSNMVHKYMRDAGIANITTREFRNVAVSNFRRLSIDPFTRRDIVGHSDVEMTYVYTDEDTRESLDAFSRLKSTYDSHKGNK